MSISRRAFIKALVVLPIAAAAPALSSPQYPKPYLGIKTPETVAELTSAMIALFSPMAAGDAVFSPVVYAWGVNVLDCDETPKDEWERKLVRHSWLTATAHHASGKTRMFLRSAPALFVDSNFKRHDTRISLKFRAAFV